MFALGGVAKYIMYTIHFETILLKSCDFFKEKKLLSTVISMEQL